MSRSAKKGPFCGGRLLEKVEKMRIEENPRPIKTWARSSTIFPEFIGFTFAVHDGKKHVNVYCVEEMVGHKLGEFSPTRKFFGHSGSKALKDAHRKKKSNSGGKGKKG